ncbi:hypothetical protein ACH5RR_024431 [Cinchona calisaya]|uniref:F-box domain-containing protein n=1 Tax=Cinchona calisaya TaxID=153742 RepID=A0ABD2YXU7_9GENT
MGPWTYKTQPRVSCQTYKNPIELQRSPEIDVSALISQWFSPPQFLRKNKLQKVGLIEMKFFRDRILQLKLVYRDHAVRGNYNRGKEVIGQHLVDGNLPSSRKRKNLHADSKPNRVKKKKKVGEINGVDEGIESMDWFSELPEHIIHHILALLRCPKDVARTSVLSKKWKNIWTSFNTFSFDQRNFHVKGAPRKSCRIQASQNRENFVRHIRKSMETRIDPLHSIHKFRLHITSFTHKLAPSSLNSWIDTAVRKHVKELDIHVKLAGGYSLPSAVFTSKTITSLKLYSCKLDGLGAIQLPKLRELFIKGVHVEEATIQNFVHSCPLIEDFRIIYCGGLERLHVSSLYI